MAINVPLNAQLQNATQLQQQVQNAVNAVRINLGGANGARSLSALSQPLGRLTGQADEFTKSLDAANARVLAFGASVGVVNAVSNAFKALVSSTIEVEKAITEISVVGDQFNGKTKQLSQGLFNIAKTTGQSFAEVSRAALEFSRQGLNLEETLQRTKDALVLTRTTGLDAAKSVDGLTAAVNAFAKAGLSTTQVLNKLAAVDQAFAVSSADLIEAFQRTGAVAQQAGVSFDELAGIVTALQTETSRGGAVIGNALKTIFSRLQDTTILSQLQGLGVAVVDVKNNVLPARQILQNLAGDIQGLSKVTQAGVFKDVAGTFQLNQLVSLLGDLNKQQSISAKATQTSAGATNEAYNANEKLNQSLGAILDKLLVTGKQVGSVLGEIGLSDNLKGILNGINSFIEEVASVLQGDDLGSKFAKGIVKGIGSVLSGPGLVIFLAIIAKLSFDLAKFGAQSLKTFFNIGKAASDQKQIQESIVQVLLRNQNVLNQILSTQGGQNAQAQAFLGILNQQAAAMQTIQGLAGNLTGAVYSAGYRQTEKGLQRTRGQAAGGYLPAQEAADVRRGVGGASPSSKVVAIPNFAFGGGKRGTMIANTSEYIVPNYAGGGSAIFNPDMVKTMGLPAGAKKISAAGGFIPNFTKKVEDFSKKYALITNNVGDTALGATFSYKPKGAEEPVFYKANIYGIDPSKFKAKDGSNIYFKRFSSNELERRYTSFAVKDAKNFAEKAIGLPISPVSIQNLTNAGSVPSVVGTIFETAIQSILTDEELINKIREDNQNALFDFVSPATAKIGQLFGIKNTIPYLEAKSSASPSARKSFAKKIYQEELAGNPMLSSKKDLHQKISGPPLTIRPSNFSEQLQKVSGKNFKAINLTPEQINQLEKAGGQLKSSSQQGALGYIPNFAASALQDAIAREKSAGLSDSQIYIDQNPSLKSPQNPMGLMVANTRDEPFGGIQGISRARRQGMNPKLYGAANGFVPNYASPSPINKQTFESTISSSARAKIDEFAKLIDDINKKLSKNKITQDEANKKLEDFIRTIQAKGRPGTMLDPTKGVGKKDLRAAQQQLIAPGIQSGKNAGDALAKVFGIQSAFIGIQSIVESMSDEGSKLAETTRVVGGLIAGIGSAATLLTAGLGPLGVALAAATAGFSILQNVFPDALQSIKESFGGLSKEGEKASEALDKFAETVAAGGVTAEQAYQNAVKQAQEAQLRAKAAKEGISPQTAEGVKDPAKLARELITKQASEVFQNIQLSTPSKAKKQPTLADFVLAGLAGGAGTEAVGGGPTPEEIAGTVDLKALSDFSESTQKIILDIFEETVSLNKEGLLVLGKKLEKQKEAKDLVTEGDLINYRAELLKIILGKKEVGRFIQEAVNLATKGGVFDEKVFETELRKSDIVTIPEELLKYVVEALPKFTAEQPANKLRQNLNDLLLSFENFSSAINRAVTSRTTLLEGLVGSQTFSALSEQRQFEVKTGLERFQSNTSFQKNQRDILSEARTFAAGQAANIATASGNPFLQAQLENFAKSGTLEELESVFNNLSRDTTLVNDELNALRKQASDLINRNKDLNANREVEVQLLNFSIQERQTELNAIKTFYNGLDKFNSGIREKEREIRNLDFKKTLSEQTAQYERELAQLTSTSPEELRTRTQAADTKATKDQASIERKQNEIRARIEAEQAINTVENIKALNRNTEVLQKLLTQFSIEGLQKQLTSIISGASGRSLTPSEQAEISNITSQISALQNPPQSTGDIKDLSSLAFPASRTEIDKKIGELGVLTDEEKAKYKGIFNRYFDQIEIGIDAEKARNDALKNQQGLDDQLFKIRQSYVDDIANELKSLRESQYSPKSMGQFAATERQIKMAQRKESLKNNPEKVREYLSSFGYGFDEAMSKVEERTLDFRNQLGKEIPDLFSQNLAQGLNDAISGAKTLKEALMDAATSFFQEITRKNISNLADLVTGGIGNLVGGFFQPSIPKAIPVGPNEYASGGFIKGGSGTKDDVPAMLMGGEYVVKKSAVNKYGKGFFDAINSGRMRGYAAGGMVDPQTFPTQTGRGGFFTPGDYGQGAITGKNELLTFATQSFTGGQYDYMGGFGMGGATVSLEPESARLSALGREGSPMFERVQQSKDEAFRVYLEGLQKEKEYADLLDQIAKNEKARKKQLQMAIISAVVSSVASYAGSAMSAGAKNATAAAAKTAAASGQTLSTGAKFMAGFKGMFTGAGGQGGLANIFKGTGSIFKGSSNKSSIIPTNQGGVGTLLPELTPEAMKAMGLFYVPSDGSYNPYPTKRAAGGLISGGSNIRDDVPAMLTGGEFVLNNRATQRIGLQNLNRLNSGAPVSSEGSSPEMTQTLIAKLDELIQTTANSSKENVVVNVSTNEAGGQTTENPTGTERDLQKKIRQAVLDVIAQEKRLGGSLEKSR
jgi:TP901 family phage tail tape measure protein